MIAKAGRMEKSAESTRISRLRVRPTQVGGGAIGKKNAGGADLAFRPDFGKLPKTETGIPKIAGPQIPPPPKSSPSRQRWYGTGQMALRCGISTQTIRNDIDRGKINAKKTGSGRYVIPRAEVERYMEENGYGEPK